LLQLGDKGPERKKILVERQNAPVLTGEDRDRDRRFGDDPIVQAARIARRRGGVLLLREHQAERPRWE